MAAAWSLVLACLLLQDTNPYRLPEELLPFWRQYSPSKDQDDESGMDRAVRLHREKAELTLDFLLEELSLADKEELAGEIRTLAWSLDRTQGDERFIERVRFVLAMEPADRKRRSIALGELTRGLTLFDNARLVPSDAAWEKVVETFEAPLGVFEDLGDKELSIRALSHLAQVEAQRGRPFERSQYLERMIEIGADLGYEEGLVQEAQRALAEMEAAGEAPAEGGEGTPAEGGAVAGRGLTSFAEGSVEQRIPLASTLPKKGVNGGVTLPSFQPYENEYLWNYAWVEKDGPSDFDIGRNSRWAPGGRIWKMRRDGTEYGLDADGDGQVDVSFRPTSTPARVDVPVGDGRTVSITLAICGDKEQQFGIQVNYFPALSGARVRFHAFGWLQGAAGGTSLAIHDANISGSWGDTFENWGDQVTNLPYDENDHVTWWDTDAVVIGKETRAIPWSTVLPLDGKFYKADLQPDGSELVLRELDLPIGHVKLDLDAKLQPTHLVVRSEGELEGAFFDVVPAKKGGAVALPAGSYSVAMGRIATGTKTSLDQIRIYAGEGRPFFVEEGKTVALELGAPYRFTCDVEQVEEEAIVRTRSLRVFGRGGEEYAMFFDEPPLPSFDLRLKDGKALEKGRQLLRPGVADFQNDTIGTVLWFPVEHAVANPAGEPVEIRLTQKEHKLLGGPFDSDWIP